MRAAASLRSASSKVDASASTVSATASARSRIADQSSTAARTSPRTRTTSRPSSSSTAASVCRSTSRWTNDSAVASDVGSCGSRNVDDPPRVAPDRHDRVHGEVQSEAVPDDLRRHRVDDERHVVGDDVDDGVRRAEAVLLEVRGEHPHRGCARRPVEREGQVRHRAGVQVVHVPGREVAAGDVPVVLADERLEQPLLLRGQPLVGVPPDLVDDLGPVAGRDGGHGNPLRPRPSVLSSGAPAKEHGSAGDHRTSSMTAAAVRPGSPSHGPCPVGRTTRRAAGMRAVAA